MCYLNRCVNGDTLARRIPPYTGGSFDGPHPFNGPHRAESDDVFAHARPVVSGRNGGRFRGGAFARNARRHDNTLETEHTQQRMSARDAGVIRPICDQRKCEMELIGYWRSSAAYRVRIGMNLKNLSPERSTKNLRTGEQRGESYLALNPQGLVPALIVSPDVTLTQSMAILEWLDETVPSPPLLPTSPQDRCLVRAMCQLMAADIHPLANLRVLNYLRRNLSQPEDAVTAWAQHWISEGLVALEQMVRPTGPSPRCFGAETTLADVCLVPQMASARRFGCDLAKVPTLVAIDGALNKLQAFSDAAPERQTDAVPT